MLRPPADHSPSYMARRYSHLFSSYEWSVAGFHALRANQCKARPRILLAERTLGGDTPAASIRGFWRPLRSWHSKWLLFWLATLCLEMSLRDEVRLTESCFGFK